MLCCQRIVHATVLWFVILGSGPLIHAQAIAEQQLEDQAATTSRENDQQQDRFERHLPITVGPVELKVLTGRIDNDKIRDRFIDAGRSLIRSPTALTSTQIVALLEQRKAPVTIPLPQVPLGVKIKYADIAQASLLFGTIYDCGRCNNIHENVAGGVVISADGLAVTNFHVLNQDQPGTLAMFGMTCDGTPRPVLDVLYANKLADVALIRLGGDAPFHPVPIAHALPMPLDPVTVLSNPKHNYFVLTTGVVNRHVSFRGRTGFEEFWMDVTAEYAAGSSGSGVFDAQGGLIGLVSSNAPLPRTVSDRLPGTRPVRGGSRTHESYYEMTLRRCVTVEAIRACFAERR